MNKIVHRTYAIEQELAQNFKIICVYQGKQMSEVISKMVDNYVRNYMSLIDGRKRIDDY